MILMAFLGLVVMMMMTSGVTGKTYLVKTADGGLPSAPHSHTDSHARRRDRLLLRAQLLHVALQIRPQPCEVGSRRRS